MSPFFCNEEACLNICFLLLVFLIALLLFVNNKELINIIIIVILFFISNYLINLYSKMTNSYDSRNIIIDEFLGIYIIFFFYDYLYIYNNYITLILIFFIFRFFDIIKIYPANYIDKNIKNGYGVILDDLIAGIYTIVTMIILNAII